MKKNKSENREAFPKFLGIALVGLVCGLMTGFIPGYLNQSLTAIEIYQKLNENLHTLAPYVIWLSLIILSGIAIYDYRKAKDIFAKWDGEDDNFIRVAENKISYSIMFSQMNMIITFFFFTITVIGEMDPILPVIISLIGFLLTLAVIVYIQQKNVDLTKAINPEKKGSVYDPKFQKKWLATCDENEIRQIGQASYKAYTATTTVCIILLLVSLFISDILDAGFYPSLLVVIIWATASIVYFIEAIRISK